MTQFETYFHNKEFVWKPGLERVKRAIDEADFKSFPSIIVAGTNGKGSTSYMIAEVLRQNGLKVGLFTSPHLFRFNERFKLKMETVETGVLDTHFNKILPLIEKHKLTYFEAAFLLALRIFSSQSVDAAVFEVGLGGRLDATNVVSHDLAVITHVDVDHKNYLGSTLREIAEEKLAVIKNGVPAVISENPTVVEELAKERTEKLYCYGKEFKVEGLKVLPYGTEFKYKKQVVRTNLIGKHQAVNGVTALKACEVFLQDKFGKPLKIGRAINISLPGRFETIRKSPTVIFDVAHNKDALKRLFETAKDVGLKADVIFSGLKDKDLEENLKVVADYLKYSNGKLYLLQIKNERAASIEKLLEIAKKVGIKKTSKLETVKLKAVKKDTIVTGSFYIAELIDDYKEGVRGNKRGYPCTDGWIHSLSI